MYIEQPVIVFYHYLAIDTDDDDVSDDASDESSPNEST